MGHPCRLAARRILGHVGGLWSRIHSRPSDGPGMLSPPGILEPSPHTSELTSVSQFFRQCHSQLGIILVCLVSLQPFLGFLHHRHYLRHKQRGIISYLHIWYGRSLIILGMINGGLGLQLAGLTTDNHAFIVAYCVVVAVVAAAYIACVLLKVWRTGCRAAPAGSPRDNKMHRAVSAATQP